MRYAFNHIFAALAVAALAAPVVAQSISEDGVAVGQTIQGTLRVTDGDTIALVGARPLRVRIHGIDAAEIGQTCLTEAGTTYDCGAWVAQRVHDLWAGEWATCRVVDVDRYGRAVGVCQVDGRDLGASIVRRGLAIAHTRYSRDYVNEEAVARTERAGVFAGTMQDPAWHRVARIDGRVPPDPDCAIKGNVTDNGRIYHLPGGAWYDRTGIRPEEGERWFCSEEEARAAGWRAARG